MSEKKYYWLKLKRDFFKRHDIRIVEAMPNGKDYILFYLKLLLESIDHEGALKFSETIPYNEQMLSVITNTNIDVVRSAMRVFSELNMIDILDDKTIYMNECTKLIGSETSVAERVRKHRDNKSKIDQQVLTSAKTSAERQRNFRAKKSCEEKQHIPFIEDHMNNKRYGGNYYVVIKRDKYECAICGSIENICVHHIDGYDENKPTNNNENKMLTLCRSCHSQVHAGMGIPKNILDSIDYYENSNEKLPCNADVTVTKRFCNTEKDIEIDKDIDKDIYIGVLDNSNTAESSADATADGEDKAEVPVLYLPLIGNLQFPIFAKDIEDWQPAYPAIDVLQELYRMRSWFDANPKNKKTELGIKRFIVNWLGRSQDRAPRTQPNASQSLPNNQTKENKTAQMLHESYDMMQEWAESMEGNDDSE